MSATYPEPAPLDPKDYEIVCLKLRNKHLVAALELIMEEDWDAFRIAKHTLAIARGET